MRRFHAITRDLHLYGGLFLSPFIVLFAVSTFFLNHPTKPASSGAGGAATAKRDLAIDVPAEETGTLEQAKKILTQLGVSGEIDYVRHNAKAERLLIPVSKPGATTNVEVDLRAKTATVKRQDRGLVDALIYLHRMPGPHNVRFRGNWVYMAWWGITADVVVYGILFLTVSGLVLWWVLKPERKAGWILLGGGAATVALMVGVLVIA